MFNPRDSIKQSFSKGQHAYNSQNVQVHTNYQRQVRGHKKYTNYNSYTKQGGKNWKEFK